MNLDGIPLELRKLNRWVVGSASKVPVDPNTGGLSKTNDPTTWSSFDYAVEYYNGNKDKLKLLGVGFVLTGNEFDVSCIDLDRCIVNRQTTEEATQIIRCVDSYSETSVSGSGIHIWLFGKKPGARQKGKIEIFDATSTKYVIVTGDHIEKTPDRLNQRQTQLEEIYSKYFPDDVSGQTKDQEFISPPEYLSHTEILQKMFAAKNGDKTKALWDGLWSDLGYQSESEADFALVNEVAFWWGNDPIRIYDALCESPHYQNTKKTEKKHCGFDGYWETTIKNALKGKVEFCSWLQKADTYDPEEPSDVKQSFQSMPILLPEGFQKLKVGNRDVKRKWLIRDWMWQRENIVIYGPSGTCKTFLALDMSLSIAFGVPFADKFPVRPGNVFYVAAEDRFDLQGRCEAWIRHHHINKENERFFFRHTPFDLGRRDVYANVEFITKEININNIGIEPDLIVFDTMAKNFRGEENSSEDIGNMILAMETLRQKLETSVMVIHHTGKDISKGERGSSALRAGVDNSIEVSRDGAYVQAINRKMKSEVTGNKMYFEPKVYKVDETNHDEFTGDYTPTSLALSWVPEEKIKYQQVAKEDDSKRYVIANLPDIQDAMRKQDICKNETGDKKFSKYLNELLKSGYIGKKGKGVKGSPLLYYATPEGRQWAMSEPKKS